MSTSKTEPIEGARAVLRELPLLALMPPDARRLVEASFVPVRFPFGAVIVREGDDADAFYVLVAGTARVVKRTDQGTEVPLNVLRPGDAFGERALLEHSRRTATVRASSEVQALRLDRSIFQALAADNPEIREHLDVLVRRHHLRDFLRLHTVFGRLPADALAAMLAELRPVHVEAGEVVLRQGDPPGPMYLVQDGRLRVSQEEGGEFVELAYLRTGDVFGEIALFTGRPRQATVEAVSPCALLELGQDTFRRLVDDHPQFRERIAERVSQWDYRRLARVPLDFGQELLPVEAEAREKVGLDQVDEVHEDDGVSVAAVAPPEAPAPAPPSRSRRLRRFPQVWQIDEQDCGAACVAMVCRHFGTDVSLTRIREAVHTGVEGTSLLGIARGAETLGLAARTVKASKSRLDELPLPAVVHWEGNHWVVLHDLDRQRARIADPARGLRRLARDEFEAHWSGYAALLRPTPALERGPQRRATLPWLADAVRPHRRALTRIAVLAVLAAILQMLIPVFAQVIVDRVVERDDPDLLRLLVPLMGGVLGLALLATILQRRLLSSAAAAIDGAVLDALTRRVLSLPLRYFSARRSGDIERRLVGVRQVRQLLLSDGVNGLAAVLQLLLALGLMLVYSWRLALVYAAVLPLYAALVRFGSRRVRPMADSIEESLGRYQARQVEAIRGIETVKAVNAEAGLRRVMLGQFEEVADRLRRAHRATMVYEGAIQAVPFLSVALFLWIGALEVLADRLTIGELVGFNVLVLLANAATVTLLVLAERFQQAGVLLDRLSDVLEQEPEQPRTPDRKSTRLNSSHK
jgi:CRP-like cAMP-binding protein/predicted double-glycine peptidase